MRSCAFAPMPWICIGSVRIWPTVKRGLSDAYGFWKMIWMRRLYGMNSLLRHRQDVAALEDRLAGGRLVQAHQRQADRRLARARFADEPERLALGQPERHVLHRLELALAEEALARIEVLAEVLHVEDDRVARRDAARALGQVHRVRAAVHEVVDHRQAHRAPVELRPALAAAPWCRRPADSRTPASPGPARGSRRCASRRRGRRSRRPPRGRG